MAAAIGMRGSVASSPAGGSGGWRPPRVSSLATFARERRASVVSSADRRVWLTRSTCVDPVCWVPQVECVLCPVLLIVFFRPWACVFDGGMYPSAGAMNAAAAAAAVAAARHPVRDINAYTNHSLLINYLDLNSQDRCSCFCTRKFLGKSFWTRARSR